MTTTISVRLDTADYEALRTVCDREGVTASDLLRQSIREMAVLSPATEWE